MKIKTNKREWYIHVIKLVQMSKKKGGEIIYINADFVKERHECEIEMSRLIVILDAFALSPSYHIWCSYHAFMFGGL